MRTSVRFRNGDQGLQVYAFLHINMRKLTSICEDWEKYAKMTIMPNLQGPNFQRFFQCAECKIGCHLKSTHTHV